jgi:hypothetical protein
LKASKVTPRPNQYQGPTGSFAAYTGGGDWLSTMVQSNNVVAFGPSGMTVAGHYQGATGTDLVAANAGGRGAYAHGGNVTLNANASVAIGISSIEASGNIDGTSVINGFTTNSTFANGSSSTPSANVSTTAGYVVIATSVDAASTFDVASLTQAGSYAELHQALAELHALDDDDDWKIQTPVYHASLQVAATLIDYAIPKPKVFTHGPKSVVFNWTGSTVDLYLTISKSRLSLLVSSAEGIDYRTEFSADSGEATNRFFSALRSTRLIAASEASDSK